MTPQTTRLYLLRHAEVEENYQMKFGGRLDMELSPRGHAQSASLAAYLRQHEFDAVYSSPMRRVRQTIAPLWDRSNPGVVELDGLREVDFGLWTGLTWHEVSEKHQVSAFDWLDLLDSGAIPEAESGPAFRARVEPCIHGILADHPGRSIAIACHGGVVRMILAILLDLPLPRTRSFEVEYASITRVDHDPRGSRIQLLNFTPWRDLP